MIDDVLIIPAASVSGSDFFRSEIAPQLGRDPDWRQKAQRSLAGEGITNQGVSIAKMLLPGSMTICGAGLDLKFAFIGHCRSPGSPSSHFRWWLAATV
jgi:hypothetical protein